MFLTSFEAQEGQVVGAVSGGVDSSVAALLMKNAWYGLSAALTNKLEEKQLQTLA